MTAFSYSVADGIATLTFDMPDRAQNVWNASSIRDFSDIVAKFMQDETACAAIITSGKRDFAAGADLALIQSLVQSDSEPTEQMDAARTLGATFRALETSGKPVVAALNGTALGGGFELALACHYRILVADPRIRVGLPEVTLGLLPGAGGTQRLPRLIGIQASSPLLLEGKTLGPEAARATGLVHDLVPDREALLEAAKEYLRGTPTHTQPWDKKAFVVPGGGPDSNEGNNLFLVGNALTLARTQGNYPAPKAILSCLYEGLRVPFDAGLDIELRYFVYLLRQPTTGAMVRTFFVEMQKANKLAGRPPEVPRRTVTTVGILGAGLMGSGIAYVAASKGLRVVVLDTDIAKAEGARAYAARIEDRAIAKRRSTEAKKSEVLGRIHASTEYADLSDCDVVVEAVFEDRSIKAHVTRQADAVTRDTCLFGSNTSTLPITGLATASVRPERFIGLHFFSPVERMPLVEVIRGALTSDESLAWALDFVAQIGKTPIVVEDRRGFYTSRVFGTYVAEGIKMVEEGVLPALVENAGRKTGMPMPPLALADEVGLGLILQVDRQTRIDLGNEAPEYAARAVLEQMVDQLGRVGRKNHKGFYEYTVDAKGKPDKRLYDGLRLAWPTAPTQPSVDSLTERLLVIQAVEAARAMDEGVISRPGEADVGAILGWGFAPWTGGPFSYIHTMGLSAFVARADALADQHGERFRPPALLRTMALNGHSFF